MILSPHLNIHDGASCHGVAYVYGAHGSLYSSYEPGDGVDAAYAIH